MSYLVELNLPASKDQARMTIVLEMEQESNFKGVWRLVSPIPAGFRAFTTVGRGTWTGSVKEWDFSLREHGTKKLICALSRNWQKNGAFEAKWGKATSVIYDAYLFSKTGTWRPRIAKGRAHTWGGLMFKASIGAGASAEGAIAVLTKVGDSNYQNAVISVTSGRAGLIAGLSSGAAIVLATGFANAQSFHRHVSSGSDWALTVGPKWKSIVDGKAAKIANSGLPRLIRNLVGDLDATSKMAERLEKLQKWVKGGNPAFEAVRTELPGAVKTLYGEAMIDYSTKNLTAVDIPGLSGGTEIGFFYKWDQIRLHSSTTTN